VQESTLPEKLAARARKIAESVRNSVHKSSCTTPSIKKQPPNVLSTTDTIDWLTRVYESSGNTVFTTMREELTQLNALYARALAQAAALMHARRVGLVSDGAAAAMHAVEGTMAADTMAAMEALNDLAPIVQQSDVTMCALAHLMAMGTVDKNPHKKNQINACLFVPAPRQEHKLYQATIHAICCSQAQKYAPAITLGSLEAETQSCAAVDCTWVCGGLLVVEISCPASL
jgi:hypothetical protein